MNKKEMAYHPISRTPYFEGWYYKITSLKMSMAIIVGVIHDQKNSHAFIQTLDSISKQSQYIRFELTEFKFDKHHFHIALKDNHFYLDHIVLNLKDKVTMKGTIHFGLQTPMETSLYRPTIMGPFYYLKFLECVHSLISLHHCCYVDLKINEHPFDLKAIGYIEKDRGQSFPKQYFWLQSNHCENEYACLTLAIAKVNLKLFDFTGIVMVMMLDGQQHFYTTYLGAKVIEQSLHHIHLKQNQEDIHLYIEHQHPYALKGPQLGKMSKDVFEQLNAKVRVELYHRQKIKGIYHFTMCACEVYEDK